MPVVLQQRGIAGHGEQHLHGVFPSRSIVPKMPLAHLDIIHQFGIARGDAHVGLG